MLADRSTLAGLVERYTGRDGVHPTAVAGLTLFRATKTHESVATVHEPAFCIVAQGRKRVTLGEEVFCYDPAQFLLVSVDLPLSSKVVEATPDEPYLGVRIDLDLVCVGELMIDAAPAGSDAAPPARGLSVSPLDPPLLDAAARLVALLESPRDVAVVAPLIRREIMYRLLTGEQGGRLRQIAADGGPTRRIALAIDWLRDHFASPFRIEDLARVAHMSPSTFHQHFKAVTAMSPLQYQKRLRLQEARRLMLAEALDAAAAGYRVGYESPSQFSREYRRSFGEPPRRDMARLRTASPAAQG
ncbi:AraC family transcriptional regulator [Paludisphaera mucosa]|uniref:AraC family transcriptional regulator n=1 Tax=Paludisphaera mucosa TaxID=3030827 RepID=A0ABT6FHY3_9BACT|nr:AraC family transcriptional regulator [Paludisphaera mucosa]MDG3007182.1 AraC family transcriptional regulator [Paludisphaera mucosa]